MARPITNKYIQIHTECRCGFNSVDGFDSNKWKHSELVTTGAKRKKCKTTGSTFYSRVDKIDCDGEGHYRDD